MKRYAILISGLLASLALPNLALAEFPIDLPLSLFAPYARDAADKGNSRLKEEMAKFAKDGVFVVTGDYKPDGSVEFLSVKPFQVHREGKPVGTIAAYYMVKARVKLDALGGPFTRKIAAVDTEQLLRVMLIPRVENGKLLIDMDSEVVEATARKERQAHQAHANDFRDRVSAGLKEALSKQLHTINVSDEIGKRSKQGIPAVVARVEIENDAVRVVLDLAGGNSWAVNHADARVWNPGTITLYDDASFGGRAFTLHLEAVREGTVYGAPEGFGGAASAARWNLSPGITVVLFEGDKGNGKTVPFSGHGDQPDFNRLKFNDKFNSWRWTHQ